MEARTLGDYQLIKQIGQGSLGTVFLAEHLFMKKQYVVKILPEELASDRSFIQRFEEDVGALATLDHPHIVKIHNISFAQGQYFLVTDCIVDELGETTNLAQFLTSRSRKLEEAELAHILSCVAEALDYAHSKKIGGKSIVHRSLKLNNILIGKGKTAHDPFITDFGLSRIIGTGAVLNRTLKTVADTLKADTDKYPNPPAETQKLLPLHASFLQTYAFLAPEQRRLDHPLPIDAKTDAYAFGTLAYYMICRELPEAIFDMPSLKVPEYKHDWDRLVHTCLQADPARRPDSLSEFLKEIQKGKKTAVSAFTPANIVSETREETLSQESNGLKPVIHRPQIDRPQHDPDPAAVFQVDSTVKHYQPERKEVKNINPLLTDMVVIQGGNFMRGSNDGNRDETPKHQISLCSFAIDIHPVTNEQFVRFLEVMGGEKDSNHNDIIRLRESRIKRSGGRISIESGYAKHPVVGVTWYGAVAYARWVGKRLPTEAEWEVAAANGLDKTLYPSGDDIEKSEANFFSADTTPVMSYAPNLQGLYDMAGNVYEWCQDWYSYNYYEVSIQEPENPKGPLQGVYRVLRGGCWKSLKEDLRCSRRHRNNPGTVNGTYGFRCAADVQ